MAKRIVLIRHGSTGSEYRGRLIGSCDVELAPEGRRQASAMAMRMREENPMACYCSPLARTSETARRATDGLGVRIEPEADLREIDFGLWEGLTFDEIQRRDPTRAKAWADDFAGFVFPDGESVAGFRERLARVAGRLARDSAPAVFAFTHGGVIRALICHYLGLPSENYVLFEVEPASWNTVTLFDDKGVLTRLNDLSHCEGALDG